MSRSLVVIFVALYEHIVEVVEVTQTMKVSLGCEEMNL